MNTLERLELALSRVKRGWTQYAFARDAHQEIVSPYSTRATCWCAAGALVVDRDELDTLEGELFLERVKAEVLKDRPGYKYLSEINDNPECTKDAIVAMFEKTLARLKKEQSSDQA